MDILFKIKLCLIFVFLLSSGTFSKGNSIKFKKISVPVGWSTTSAYFGKTKASSQTESFRGFWILEQRDNGESYLSYLNRVVEVLVHDELERGQPKVISLTHSSMGYLLGLQTSYTPITENDEKLIVLKLSNEDEVEFNLKIEHDVHYSVTLSIGVDSI